MTRDHRRLAAIVSADVADYSRLMGLDESGTLAGLKAHRREVLEPKIAEYDGRIVKTTGDGLLLEFPSVVDAVRYARVAMARSRRCCTRSRQRWGMGVATILEIRTRPHAAGAVRCHPPVCGASRQSHQ